jgi:hypothetical protein
MAINRFNLVSGPAELDFFLSLQRGCEVIFHLEDRSAASFVVDMVQAESGDRKNWNFSARLIGFSSRILSAHQAKTGTSCQGFYSYLRNRTGWIEIDCLRDMHCD